LLPADYIFGAAVALVVGCNLYFGPRIKRERVAMQWRSDGKPTWYAPKWVALWGMVPARGSALYLAGFDLCPRKACTGPNWG
jgi:hypothetical protein